MAHILSSWKLFLSREHPVSLTIGTDPEKCPHSCAVKSLNKEVNRVISTKTLTPKRKFAKLMSVMNEFQEAFPTEEVVFLGGMQSKYLQACEEFETEFPEHPYGDILKRLSRLEEALSQIE